MKYIVILLCFMLLSSPACASLAVPMNDGAVLISGVGDEIVPFGTYEDIIPIGDNLFAAGNDGSYALMDADGNLLTNPVYESIIRKGELLLGSINAYRCMLSPEGQMLTEAVYSMIVPNESGGAWAIRGVNGDIMSDELLILSPDGAEKSTGLFIRSMDDESGNNLLAVLSAEDGLWGYCDAEGRMLIQPAYETASSFDNGAAIVSRNGKSGAIDAAGKPVLPMDYDFADAFEGGIIALNANGAVLLNGDQSIILHKGGGLSVSLAGNFPLVYNGENMLVYDAGGKIVSSLPADSSVYAGLENQLIVSEGAWGEENTCILGSDKRYQHIYPFGYANGRALYACLRVNVGKYMNNLLGEPQYSADMDSARYGLLDSQGETILPANYAALKYLDDDRILVKTDVQWRVIDTAGRIYWRRNIPDHLRADSTD